MGSIYTDNDRASKKLHFDIPGVGTPEKSQYPIANMSKIGVLGNNIDISKCTKNAVSRDLVY